MSQHHSAASQVYRPMNQSAEPFCVVIALPRIVGDLTVAGDF